MQILILLKMMYVLFPLFLYLIIKDISICLPVYNMEKYIERAFLSIINQSFQDFEIIIVNDNSNDNTEHIIKNLQFKEKRLKIFKRF